MIGHLGAEIEFFSFHRKWWKFVRLHEFWTSAEILTGRAGTTSRYSTWETPPIKAKRSEPSDHLRSTCLRINTSTRIWMRALQPDQEEVSSGRFCQAQIVRGRQTFPLKILTRRRNFTRLGDFNVRHSSIVRLNFYQADKFCMSAKILGRNFPQQFSAWIFLLNFKHLPQISWDPEISCIC